MWSAADGLRAGSGFRPESKSTGCKKIGKGLVVLAAGVAVAALVVFAFPAVATVVTGGLIAAPVLATLAIVAKWMLVALFLIVTFGLAILPCCRRADVELEVNPLVYVYPARWAAARDGEAGPQLGEPIGPAARDGEAGPQLSEPIGPVARDGEAGPQLSEPIGSIAGDGEVGPQLSEPIGSIAVDGPMPESVATARPLVNRNRGPDTRFENVARRVQESDGGKWIYG